MSKIKRIVTSILLPLMLGFLMSQAIVMLVGESSSKVPGIPGKVALDVNSGVWELQKKDRNGICTYSKRVKGTPLLAMRGTGVLDMHISDAIGTFVDSYRCYDWVDVLDTIIEMPFDKSSTCLC